ncbi:MAG: hypothetical protein IK007_05295 [Lachnospiraceae bacterium]|nr:hypothetical protein [Lachnospiraceae bacterium]
MKKEKISEIINGIDERYIEEATHVDNIISISDQKKKHNGLKWSFGSVAAIAICVILLGGITVYAFNHEAIKAFLFGKAQQEDFEDVYVPLEKEYQFGSHKMILNGVIYDEVTGVAYMSFEVQDSDGNTVKIDRNGSVFLGDEIHQAGGFRTSTQCYQIGDDKFYLLLTYSGAIMGYNEDTNYFLRIDKAKDTDPKQQFMILDEAAWKNVNAEVNKIDTNNLYEIDKEYYLETNEIKFVATDDDYMPQIISILEKYGLADFESNGAAGKVFITDKCIVTVGRTNILVDYNANDGSDITLRREDGTELELIKKGAANIQLGVFSHTGGNGSQLTAWLEFGGVIKQNEDLTLIVDGVEYK